jgi:hypothetical protein
VFLKIYKEMYNEYTNDVKNTMDKVGLEYNVQNRIIVNIVTLVPVVMMLSIFTIFMCIG